MRHKVYFTNGDTLTDYGHITMRDIIRHLRSISDVRDDYKVWGLSDTHFGHNLVSTLRGYETPEEHDQAITEAWNSVVRPGDIAIHFGDVTSGSRRHLAQVDGLNGAKILIPGNHCDVWTRGDRKPKTPQRHLGHFDAIITKGSIVWDDSEGSPVLSHIPPIVSDHANLVEDTGVFRYEKDRPVAGVRPCIHGHVHEQWVTRGRCVNVGVEAGIVPRDIVALVQELMSTEFPDDAVGAHTDLSVREWERKRQSRDNASM